MVSSSIEFKTPFICCIVHLVLKAISLVLSAVFIRFGYDRLGLRLLKFGLLDTYKMHSIVIMGIPKTGNIEIVYEDKELVKELGDRKNNDIALAKTRLDVN